VSKTLDDLESTKFNKSAFEITQTLRAKIYIIIDHILTTNEQFKPDELKEINNFFEKFILFFVAYLRYLPEVLRDVNRFFHYMIIPYSTLMASE